MKAAFVVLLLCCLSIEARELAVVELSGPPYERGLKHGRALKTQIGKSIAIWKKAGFSSREISEKLDMSVSAVDTTYARLLEKLRRLLKSRSDETE